jgi:5-hydroxyisourate hydrolase-like protein (transthyretin family)
MMLKYIPVPDEFILQPAYPNPFNPATQLKYGLRENVLVMISIYDILGRQVVELVNTEQQAGYHQVIWDGNHHASGLYFVKMTAGDYISTQKLMLVK